MNNDLNGLEHRVLLIAPTAKDAAFSQKIFKDAGIQTCICAGLATVCAELQRGIGALVLPYESLFREDCSKLVALLAAQPAWSEIPLLVLVSAHSGTLPDLSELLKLERVTYLQCPIGVVTLISTIQAALRDRERQYQLRDFLLEREKQAELLRLADQRKDEFLATLAHELRNPLAPLRSGIDLLMLDSLMLERQGVTLELMDRQLDQMVRLIDDLLDVSRITRDKLTLNFKLVELSSVVQVAVESTQQLIACSGLHLTVSLPETPVYLWADAARLTQVFANLLNNAAKYTEDEGRIDLSCTVTDSHLQVIVEDTGIGIPPNRLESIFEIFSQIDSSLNRSRGGLGLGLTLVKRLVELHGGTVIATSRGTNSGSRFVVELPLATGDGVSETTPDVDDEVPIRRYRVMVVDDTPAARQVLAMLLEKLGHDVTVASGGLEAIEMLERVRPEIIFSDIGMPGMNGYEFARRLRNVPDFRQVRLVAITGYGQERDSALAAEAGFDAHVVKPVSLKTLREIFLSVGR